MFDELMKACFLGVHLRSMGTKSRCNYLTLATKLPTGTCMDELSLYTPGLHGAPKA